VRYREVLNSGAWGILWGTTATQRGLSRDHVRLEHDVWWGYEVSTPKRICNKRVHHPHMLLSHHVGGSFGHLFALTVGAGSLAPSESDIIFCILSATVPLPPATIMNGEKNVAVKEGRTSCRGLKVKSLTLPHRSVI
jgi:hypothetical protein